MNTPEIEKRLKEIEVQRSSLFRSLDTLGAEKNALLLKKRGIEMGMLVKDREEKIYKVWYKVLRLGKPLVFGNLQRKDGTFGVMRTTHDWKKI